MKKAILNTLLVVLFSTSGFAQKSAVIDAWNYLNNNELAQARTTIDAAAKDESTKDWAKTWLYRGNIYVKIASDTTHKVKDVNALDALNIAEGSYIEAGTLDEKNKFDDDIKQSLITLAQLKFLSGIKPYNSKLYEVSYRMYTDVSKIFAFLNTKYNYGFTDTASASYAAYSALQTNRYDTSKIIYTKLLSINYKKPLVYQGLELSYLHLKDTTTALKYLEEGRTLFPDNNALMFDELNVLLSQNKTQEVLTKLKDAIAKNPNSAELNYVLGNKYDRNLQDTTNAIKYYNEALRLKPDYHDVYFSAGVMFFNIAVVVNDQIKKVPYSDQKTYDALKIVRDHLFTRSLPYMEKAYQLEPKDKETLIGLKQLYAMTGQNDKATKIDDELKALGK